MSRDKVNKTKKQKKIEIDCYNYSPVNTNNVCMLDWFAAFCNGREAHVSECAYRYALLDLDKYVPPTIKPVSKSSMEKHKKELRAL